MTNITNEIEAARQRSLDQYAKTADKHLADLIALTAIPSISFDGFDPAEVEKSAAKTAEILKKAGLENIEILRIPGTHPYVYADWLKAEGAPTVLLYAHHDVQPPLREALWKTPVFTATEKDGRLYARGIADDKAGILIHAASIAAWLETAGSLPINVKVMIEGEEEIGSTHLGAFLEKYKDRLKADCMVLTDCSNFDTGLPSLTTTLRGLISLDLTVTALDHPLHSGMWGGPIPDPVQGIAKIIASLTDENGRLAIPGIWDDVLAPSEDEISDFKKLALTDELFREQSGLEKGVELFGKDHELLTKMWREPSLSINSIQSGGKKIAGNVIMDSAWARIGLRLVPNMQHGKAMQILTDFIKAQCPWGLKVEIIPEQGANPWMTKPDHKVFSVAKKSLTTGYGREAVFIGCGGTIPFVESFTRVLGELPALLVGIEDPYTNAHSENESLGLADFHSSVRSQIHFFADLALACKKDENFWKK